MESCNHIFWWCLVTWQYEKLDTLIFQFLHADLEINDVLWVVMEANVLLFLLYSLFCGVFRNIGILASLKIQMMFFKRYSIIALGMWTTLFLFG